MAASVESNNYIEGKISIREFLVDFFGSLMPGVFFSAFFLIIFVLPVILIVTAFYLLLFFNSGFSVSNAFELVYSFLNYILKEASTIIVIVGFLVFLAFSYIIGTLFYRRDPKIPDYKSFIKVIKTFKDENEVKRWVVRITKKEKKINNNKTSFLSKIKRRIHEIILPDKIRIEREDELRSLSEFIDKPFEINEKITFRDEVQFPYNNLRDYLHKRGWHELSKIIKWDETESVAINGHDNVKATFPRSKTSINALKIRLMFHFPEKCSTIIKNEAHVRLSSSMWYVSTSLMHYGFLALVLILISIFIWYFGPDNQSVSDVIPALVLQSIINIAVIILCFRIRGGIELFLHYQRVREIFYVLETAYTAANSIEGGFKKIFNEEKKNNSK